MFLILNVRTFIMLLFCGNIADMMRKPNILIFFLLLIVLVSMNTFAQNKDGEIENQQIIVEKSRKIELPEAQRNFEKITIQKKTVDITRQSYNFNDYNLSLPFLDAKLKILSVKEEPLSKLYANYLKGGLGNYATTYLEGFLYNKRSEKFAYGANLRHFASARGPLKNSGLSDNHILLYGKYLMPDFTIESDLGYYRTARHFYGYDQSKEVSKDSMRQVFNNIAWNLGFKNNDSTAALTYQANVEISNITDRFKASETEGLIRYRTQLSLDSLTTTGARGTISIANRSDITTYVRNLISLQPFYQRKIENFTLTGGINFAYENDTLNSKKNFHIYPSLNAEYALKDYKLSFFAGLDGNMERNTFRTTVKENPWMTQRFALSHTNKQLDIYGGVYGNLLKKISYRLQAAYLNYKNLPFMINNGKDSLRFALIYDPSVVKVVRLKADISYNIDKKMLAGVQFTYQSFTVSNFLKQPWHMPKMQANYYLTYFFKDKIIFNLNSYMFAGIKALGTNGKEKDLPTIMDLNLKADYLFSKNFSAFLELNNLLANKYQRYLYYSQKGINFLLGATCSF